MGGDSSMPSRCLSLPVTLVELCGVGQREDRGAICSRNDNHVIPYTV